MRKSIWLVGVVVIVMTLLMVCSAVADEFYRFTIESDANLTIETFSDKIVSSQRIAVTNLSNITNAVMLVMRSAAAQTNFYNIGNSIDIFEASAMTTFSNASDTVYILENMGELVFDDAGTNAVIILEALHLMSVTNLIGITNFIAVSGGN